MDVSDIIKPMPAKKRANAVFISKAWRDMVHTLWTDRVKFSKPGGEEMTLIEFGAILADAVERDSPFDRGGISRWMNGVRNTDELTHALCVYFDLPSPIPSAETVDEANWCLVAKPLLDADRELFFKLLRAANAAVNSHQALADAGITLRADAEEDE